jgi:hypothetical protein
VLHAPDFLPEKWTFSVLWTQPETRLQMVDHPLVLVNIILYCSVKYIISSKAQWWLFNTDIQSINKSIHTSITNTYKSKSAVSAYWKVKQYKVNQEKFKATVVRQTETATYSVVLMKVISLGRKVWLRSRAATEGWRWTFEASSPYQQVHMLQTANPRLQLLCSCFCALFLLLN